MIFAFVSSNVARLRNLRADGSLAATVQHKNISLAIAGKELDIALSVIHVFDANSSLIDSGTAYLLNLLIVGYQ